MRCPQALRSAQVNRPQPILVLLPIANTHVLVAGSWNVAVSEMNASIKTLSHAVDDCTY
jgi:hypothetical protein